MNKTTICLILGGGAGTRLAPLTSNRSKPAVPIAGKYRLIDIPISNCLHAGLNKIFVLTQYNSASLNKHVKNTYNFDSFSNGFVEILAAEQTPNNQDWYQGTADAVRQSMHHLQQYKYDNLLILSGDQLYQMDFQEMLSHHNDQKAELTIATKPVHPEDASGFGIMKVNQQSKVTNFIEKPKLSILPDWRSDVQEHNKRKGRLYLASMGIYIFSKKAIQRLFNEKPQAMDFGKEIIPYAIMKQYQVNSYQFEGYWTDIGTIRSFYDANISLTEQRPEFSFFTGNPIYTNPRILAPSKLMGTRIQQALIAEGSIIKAKKIKESVIGIRSKIGKKSKIIRSIIFGNDFIQSIDDIKNKAADIPIGIGKNCYIKNAIIDKNCRIGNNVSIIGDFSLAEEDTKEYRIINGIIVIKKGAKISDGTIIGLNKNISNYNTENVVLLEQAF